eukprot:6580908-Pyramimonas_sp.AAC.1
MCIRDRLPRAEAARVQEADQFGQGSDAQRIRSTTLYGAQSRHGTRPINAQPSARYIKVDTLNIELWHVLWRVPRRICLARRAARLLARPAARPLARSVARPLGTSR